MYLEQHKFHYFYKSVYRQVCGNPNRSTEKDKHMYLVLCSSLHWHTCQDIQEWYNWSQTTPQHTCKYPGRYTCPRCSMSVRKVPGRNWCPCIQACRYMNWEQCILRLSHIRKDRRWTQAQCNLSRSTRQDSYTGRCRRKSHHSRKFECIPP